MNALPYRDTRGIAYRYGSFYPTELCPFAYNETIAQEYFQTTPEGARAFGVRWHTVAPRNYGITLQANEVPKKISLTADAITKETIACENSGQESTMCTTAFRITAEELNAHRKMNAALPRRCPNCRHFARIAQRTPMRLRTDSCSCEQTNHDHGGTCPNEFKTSYPEGHTEIVYCEKCYQKEVV